ncbi:MAG: BTAD domain-containing putative transcriptional regulator [bacterium]
MRLRTLGGLWIDGAAEGADGGPRPRALALLTIVAAAGARGVSRERVVGVLWPESAPERARHALSQTLYSLRRDLGADVILAGPTLRVDPELMSSDVGELRAAIEGQDWAAASALYVGPFLEGFYLSDGGQFERWAEEERASLAHDAIRALETLARATSTERSVALGYWRRLCRLDAMNARFAIAYMEGLLAAGDRASALAHGKAHAEMVRREFEMDADPVIQLMMARLRDVERVAAATSISAVSVSLPSLSSAAGGVPATEAAASRAYRRPVWAAACVVGLAIFGTMAWRTASGSRLERPTVAVGIRDLTSVDSSFASATNEILATSLGRLADLQVVANYRMRELTSNGRDTSRVSVAAAARRAGATDLIEGELIPLAGGRLRLDLRRVDVARGVIRSGYEITGTDRIAMFDSATTLLSSQLGIRAPTGSVADVSTRSPLAFRSYEEGLRRLAQGDHAAALTLFREATREDSAFAMATYFAWRTANFLAHDAESDSLWKRALRLASRASERDRLIIQTHIGYSYNDVRALSAADSLATRYPRDPEALVRAAEVLPDLARAIALVNQSIALDSSAAVPTSASCRMCEALTLLTWRYYLADSSEATERTLRRYIALRPDDSQPWRDLSDFLVSQGRRVEATSAWQRAAAMSPVTGDDFIRQVTTSLRYDDVARADSLCSAGLAGHDASTLSQRRWYCAIALRMQGRYTDAVALAQRADMREDKILTSVVNMDVGRPLIAADEYLAIERTWPTSGAPQTLVPRLRVWYLTLSATAAIAGGDTLRAHNLVDSIEVIGRRSLYGRDPLLHHFVRGVLFAREHRDASAVLELKASIFSPTNGYTRANYELGRTMLALRRPAEGIPVVRAALHGGIEGSGLYVTRTELHELLAQLFVASGERDSAIVHYGVVERSWRSADAALRARYVVARRWVEGSRGRRIGGGLVDDDL